MCIDACIRCPVFITRDCKCDKQIDIICESCVESVAPQSNFVAPQPKNFKKWLKSMLGEEE